MRLTSTSAFKGTVYCSAVTRRLLMMKFPALCPDNVVALELNVPHAISLRQCATRVTFTLVNANHCPGAVMLHARCATTLTCAQCYCSRLPPAACPGVPFSSVETAGSTAPCAGCPCNRSTTFKHDTFSYSELAALSRPRVAVLDTTFAHHSWDFEPQVRRSYPQSSLAAGRRGSTSINALLAAARCRCARRLRQY
jgi:hypothetical protein